MLKRYLNNAVARRAFLVNCGLNYYVASNHSPTSADNEAYDETVDHSDPTAE